MWLYEELPSWLRSPTNPPPVHPHAPRGGLWVSVCLCVHRWGMCIFVCIHVSQRRCLWDTCARTELHSHFITEPTDLSVNQDVTGFESSSLPALWPALWLWSCCCPPPSPLRPPSAPFTSVHHLLSLCRLMSHTKRKWDKSSQTAIRATSKSLVGQKTGRRRQSQKRTNTSSQFYSSSRTRTRLLDVPRSK